MSNDDRRRYVIHVNIYLDHDYHRGNPDDVVFIDNRHPHVRSSLIIDYKLNLHDDALTDVYKLIHDARPDLYHSAEPGDAASACDWCDSAAAQRYRATLPDPASTGL